MKLYGLLVVQNESDIIQDTLEFLRKLSVYEAIFFYDLGSEDDTFSKAQEFKDILTVSQILNEVYTPKLRYDLLARHRDCYQEGDWVAIIDADEFYVDNPKDLIGIAEQEGANCIKTFQADFMFTNLDLECFKKEDRNLPIYRRRNYYLIDWSEERFYKYLPGSRFLSNSKPCSRKLLNRHYQYRTPEQITMRIKTRMENRKKSSNLTGRSPWLQIFSEDWRDYVVPHKVLHRYDDGGLKFGIPDCVQWKDYYSKNPYCYVIPQMAVALLEDRYASDVKIGRHVQPETRESFGRHVQRDIRSDTSAGKWKSAAAGVFVLIRFYFRTLLMQISLKYFCSIFRIRNLVHNSIVNVGRLLSGKSAGIMRAHPNPILLSDISEAGMTTLSWRCIHASTVEVHVGAPDGPLLSRAGSIGTAATGKWVLDRMVFFLQDVSNERPLTSENTIAKVPVVLMPAVIQTPMIGSKLPDMSDER